MSAPAIAVSVFAAVLLAELIGDRSLYAIASLTTRYGARSVLVGIALAHALKSLAAVLAANAVSHLSPVTIALVGSATWLLAAWAVWRREEEKTAIAETALRARSSLVAFASIAFTEWGDPGQITTALLAIRFHAPLLVWASATAALLTKSLAAAAVGATARRFLDLRWLRVAAVAVCVINAAAALARV